MTFTRSPLAMRWNAWSTRSRWRACISLPLVRMAASAPGERSMAISRSTQASRWRRSGLARLTMRRRSMTGRVR